MYTTLLFLTSKWHFYLLFYLSYWERKNLYWIMCHSFIISFSCSSSSYNFFLAFFYYYFSFSFLNFILFHHVIVLKFILNWWDREPCIWSSQVNPSHLSHVELLLIKQIFQALVITKNVKLGSIEIIPSYLQSKHYNRELQVMSGIILPMTLQLPWSISHHFPSLH